MKTEVFSQTDVVPNFKEMTSKDLNRIESLLTRTNNLPDILHLRASEIEYVLTDSDKELLKKVYTDLDDILKEVATFINVKFPKRDDYIHAWNKIDFDTKIGGIKIHTTDREHTKREWKNGMFDLVSLLKTLKHEIELRIEDKNTETNEPKVLTNNFNGNIVYAEGNVAGGVRQSSSQNKTMKTPAPTTATIKKILIGVFISVIGGLILWYLTTKS